MAKQTRRSVSIKGDVYGQLRCLCDKHEVSMSSVTQQLVECFLVIMADKERIDDEVFVVSAQNVAERRPFSVTTPAEPVLEKPLSGGGTHLL